MNKGQVAYEALGEFRNWRLSITNSPMRSWIDLPDNNKAEWEVIANAVLNYKEDEQTLDPTEV